MIRKTIPVRPTLMNEAGFLRTATAILMLLGLAAPALARTAGRPAHASRKFENIQYLKNQWRINVSNYGTFGYSETRSGGGEWPAGSGNMYIYGAGIWIGTLKKSARGKDTLATIGYNPNSGKSEMTPGCYDNAPGGYGSREFERVYLYPEDWPPDTGAFPAGLRGGRETPLRLTGDPNFRDSFYYVPRGAVSSGDAWTVYNDRDPAQHVASLNPTPRPIGIEVYQTTYSWTLPWNRDIVFFKLDVRNRDTTTLSDVYVGMVCDADVGNSADDMCGLALSKYIYNNTHSDSVFVNNMGYVWSNDQVPSGIVGFDFLQSPFKKDENGRIRGWPDTMTTYPNSVDDNGNGLIDEPSEGEQIGMTSFKIFTLTDADPKDDFEQYLAMAGYDYGNPQHPYNPYDSSDAAPADKRFLQSTGPFSLAPDSIVTVTIAVIAAERAPGSDTTMTYNLALASQAAQQAYDNNWIAPEPPPSPNVTTIPGDGRVTLVWDDFPQSARDRFFPLAPSLFSPFYLEQDFQGYKVYRSRTGQPNSWQLLAQYDKNDGLLYEDTTVVDSLRTKATDAGLAYSYVDSSHLRLGFPYYYAVTSFDINFLGGDSTTAPDTLSLESGIMSVRTTPRTQAGNYHAPRDTAQLVAGNKDLALTVEPLALVPYAVKSEKYRIQFQGPAFDAVTLRPVYGYLVTDQAGNIVVPLSQFMMAIDTITPTVRAVPTVFDSVITDIRSRVTGTGDTVVDTSRSWLPIVQMAMALKMDQIPKQFYEKVSVVSGTYPESTLKVPALTQNKSLWAYRGSDYRIVWQRRGSAVTAEVYDLDLGLPVPYRFYPSGAATQDSADGWSFRTSQSAYAADTFVVGRTLSMYLVGSSYTFTPAVTDTPQAGDTWIVYNRLLTPAPFFAAAEAEFVPGTYTDTTQVLHVKVVPNPYLVTNEWERHHDFRKLKFINLPNRCTIRIYNMAGDLVRLIEHIDTKPAVGGPPGQFGGDEDWDLLNESRQKPAPGTYFFHVESDMGSQVGKFVLIF